MVKPLEYLRLFAALLVVFAHLPLERGNVFNGSLFSGAIGVDIFFIISGFVMYISSSNLIGSNDAKVFLIKRIFRIMPLYLFVTLIFLLLSGQYKDLALDTLFLSLLLLPIETELGEQLDPIIYLGWTLRFELFFYLITSVAILTRHRTLAVSSLVFFSIIVNYFSGFYYGEPIIIEFLFGYLLAYLYKSRKYESALLLYSNLAVTAVLFAFAATGVDSSSGIGTLSGVPRMSILFANGLEFPRWIVWGVPSLLFVMAFLLLERHFTWRGHALGKYTYSIYLMQVILIPVAFNISKVIGGDAVAILMLTFLVPSSSWFIMKFFERPVGRFLAKRVG